MIEELSNVLQIMDSVGVEYAEFTPMEEGGTIVAGRSSSRPIYLLDSVSSDLVPNKVRIRSIKNVLSRIRLFDLTRASVQFVNNNDGSLVHHMEMKEGRRKIKTTFEENDLRIPKVSTNKTNEDSAIILEKEYAEYLTNVMSSISMTGEKEKQFISIGTKDGVTSIEINDGSKDSFVEQIESDSTDTPTTGRWELITVQKVLKEAVKQNEDGVAVINISERGMLHCDVAGFNVMITPFAI